MGFSREELEGIAADVANNLELDEEASDEDVNAEIEKQVNAVLPYLKIAQKTAQRTIQSFKDSQDLDDDEVDDDDDDPAGNKKPIRKQKKEKEEQVPAWAQALITQNKALQTEILGLKSERENDGRRSKLKALLKDKGTFGKTVLKNFDKMKFENESEFDDFYDGVVEDLAAIDQERANEGLGKLGAPAAQRKPKKEEVEVIKDNEIDELAETM
ncbi:MAG TPA: hypothetical protein DCL96_06985 [Prevotella sp.]|nr:hypothetical protein [Prevotella sp.]